MNDYHALTRQLDAGHISVAEFVRALFGPDYGPVEAEAAFWLYVEAGGRRYTKEEFEKEATLGT